MKLIIPSIKNTVLFFAFMLTPFLSWTQDLSDVFTSSKTEMLFVGLDFSEVKCVGAEGFSDPIKIQNYYFNVWNHLLISESEEDLRRAFMKREIAYDLAVVEDGNGEVEALDMVTNKTPKSFSEEKIQEMVLNYEIEDTDAQLGLSFIVHSLNKFQERAYVYVVIFDTKSKKVLFSEKVSGEAKGFGFRNYWINSIQDIIEQIQDTKFRRWKKEVTKKQEG